MKEGDPRGISKTDLSRLARTAKMAATSKHHRFRIGATLWKGGRYLAGSPNIVRGGPDVPPGRFSVHAEIACANWVEDCSGCTLYIVRLDANDDCVNSRPCTYCMRSLTDRGVSRIVFSAEDNKFESILP